ncbi:Glycosyl transferases group 1 [Streptosporangium canum]|uniref:Glycosyl transferases group 1 n=1 Tax=Streptosporangium canum TaxID=324952 RepID=A0A1I3XKH4_9ACTN|nr:glycosyltransferase [Streptosporangium canum]SFK20107.1 Glycosyl transferases group 1 [Streptosporangium canum]
MTPVPDSGWVVVTNYPTWPSPYFAELHRHAPSGLPLGFVPTLDDIPTRPAQPGVINLHRLKRLYLAAGGQRTLNAAKTMLDRLSELHGGGWRIVWTVHNLLPIDGGAPGDADWYAALGVLGVADALLTHTCSDAAYVARLTSAPVVVTGWTGLTVPPGFGPVPEPVQALTGRLRSAPYAVLVMGNITAYKDLPAVVEAFIAHTRRAHLVVAGPCRDDTLARQVMAAANASGGRVHVHPHRILPEHAHRLYRAADAALCPYRADGAWQFFTNVLHPSSVGTALTFGTPVIAPDLPAVVEMTAGYPARLYLAGEGPGQVLVGRHTTLPGKSDPAGAGHPVAIPGQRSETGH